MDIADWIRHYLITPEDYPALARVSDRLERKDEEDQERIQDLVAAVRRRQEAIQRGRPTGFFMIAMPAEVVDAAAREKLATIDRVFGMHLAPTPWTEVTEAVRAARGR